MEVLLTVLILLGSITVLNFLIRFLWESVKQLIPLGSSLHKYGQKQGKWALVTGGTDGIGLGFCEVFAQIGWNLCIVSRNQDKIKKRIQQIKINLAAQKKKTPLFKYIVADFKDSSKHQFFQNIVAQIGQIEIGILVNNVGTADLKPFIEYSNQQIIDIINVNCVSMAGLIAAFIAKMKLKTSAIINLSSFIAQNPAPYSALYSGTKAFNTNLSQSLTMETGLEKIDILSVRPMFVESPLSKQKKSFTVPDRRQCAMACLKQLRWEYQTHGYYIHRIMGIISSFAPKFIRRLSAKWLSEKVLIEYKNS